MEKQLKNKHAVLNYILLVAAVFLVPAALRSALMLKQGVYPGVHDLRGFFSDLSMSFLYAAIIVFFCRRWQWSWIVLLALWCFSNYGGYEHIRALNALPGFVDAKYLANATFLGGSALRVSSFFLLSLVLACSLFLAWLVFRTGGRAGGAGMRWQFLLLPALATLAVRVAWQGDNEALRWRQAHFVYDNLHRAVAPLVPKTPVKPATEPRDIKRFFRADLEGEPIIKLGNKGQNVLLIMLESVSGAYLDTMASTHGAESPVRMPLLSGIARDNIAYTSFVANQRQTIRGEYSLLCGGYPSLVSRETLMSERILANDTVRCLPGALRDAGYETVYLQTAPLGFMLKDQVMSRMGFSKVYGDEWFQNDGYSRSIWGVDDRAFFEQSVEMVRGLQKGERPWMLTLLTVGTHHPYNVPGSYSSPYPKGSLEHALSYLDSAAAEFVEALESEGLLEDTLVLITSDESPGIRSGASDFMKILTQNWGFLVAMPPQGMRMEVDDRFMQVDLAISVLDYLGLADLGRGFAGRSVFRKYAEDRQIFFGNVLTQTIWSVDPSGRLFLCDENFSGCNRYKLKDDRLFSPDTNRDGAATEQEKAVIMSAATRDAQKEANRDFDLKLIEAGTVPLHDVETQMVFGYQWITLPPFSCIDIDLEAELRGGEGLAELEAMLKSGGGRGSSGEMGYALDTPPMRPGDIFELSYSYCAEKEFEGVNCLLNSRKVRGRGMELHILKANMAVSPREERTDKDETLKAYLNGVEHSPEEMRDKAVEIYAAELKNRPDTVASYINLGIAYSKKGMTEQAVQTFRAALGLKPDDASIHSKIGIAYAVGGMLDEAIASFEKALNLDPDNPVAKDSLADIYQAKGMTEEAERLLR